jgi:hypothetical protein
MSTIKLEFKVEEIDTILGALGDQPYVKVAELIGNIRSQAIPQVQAMNGVAVSTEEPAKE